MDVVWSSEKQKGASRKRQVRKYSTVPVLLLLARALAKFIGTVLESVYGQKVNFSKER